VAGSSTTEADVEDLDATSTEVVEDHGDDGDEEGAEVESATGATTEADADADAEFEEPAWLSDELADAPTTDVETAAEGETDTGTEEAAPASKPRRARSPRKSTTKAAADAEDGDAGGSGEEEKG
jgi:hypothetical protein